MSGAGVQASPSFSARRRFPIAAQVGATYGLTAVLLMLLGLGAYDSSQRLSDIAIEGARTQRILIDLTSIQVDLLNAETGQRGFVITGKDEYLAPYLDAQRDFAPRLATVRLLEGRDDEQIRRIDSLADLGHRKFRELDETIALRRDRGLQAGIAAVDTDAGRKLMDEIRQVVNDVSAVEVNRLAANQAAAISAAHQFELFSIFGIVASLVVSVMIGGFITRRIGQRLGDLTRAALAVSRGRLDIHVSVAGRDEVSTLGEAFNRMIRRLKEATDALDSFAYSVSHDLRAPLRAMQGFSQALIEDFSESLDSTGRNYAARIAAAAGRMDQLIQDLLTYSRLGRADLECRPVALDDVIRFAVDGVSEEVHRNGGAVDVVGAPPLVLANRAALQQVMSNLITNAVKFVAPGTPPRIVVRCEEADGRVRLWVEDNGIGIAEEHHQRIFDVFQRLHGAETYPGTGIGLSIVRKGVERMGGTCGVQSELGRGSRFWIELAKAEGE